MDAYEGATVYFVADFAQEVGDFLYHGEVSGVEVRLDQGWVHIHNEPGGSRADSFPASAIKCVAWDESDSD